MVTDVIVGQSILHIAAPNGHLGKVNLRTTSKGMHSKATVRSATAKFTRRKLRVVRMLRVCMTTRQTRVLPTTLTKKIVDSTVKCTACIHSCLEIVSMLSKVLLVLFDVLVAMD